jgi:hypothetical protein
VCEGARRMLAAGLEAEVDTFLAAHRAERDERGRRLVVCNGHARQRQVTTAAGAVAVRAPRVDDRRTDPVTGQLEGFFGSAAAIDRLLSAWQGDYERSCRRDLADRDDVDCAGTVAA